MTGFRLGKGGFQGRCGVSPDLTAFGKVMGGGLPIGAFGGRADIMDQLSPDGPVYQAGTLSGNPLAMAAGLAQLRELERTRGYDRLEEIGRQMEGGMHDVLNSLALPLTFHRIGSMFCLYFTAGPVWNLSDARKSDLEAFRRFFHGCLNDGIYFAPSQFEAGFLCLMHTKPDLERTLDVVTKNLQRTCR